MKPIPLTDQPFPKKRLLGITSLMIILVGGGIWGFNATFRTHQASSQTNTEQTEAAEVAVDTTKIGHQTMRRDRVVTGTVSSQKSVTLTTRVNGVIEEILVNEGDRVTKGDLIAKIDVRDIQAQANQAQANLLQAQATVNSARSAYISAQSHKNQTEAQVQQAKGELQEEKAELEDAKRHQTRMKMLYENGAVSKSHLDEANTRLASSQARIQQIQANIQQTYSAVEQARSQMEQAQSSIEQAHAGVTQAQANWEQITANLDYGNVRAPFDGVITKKQAQEGAMAGAMAGFGQPIVTVETVNNLELKVSVPESLLGTVSVGERMPVKIDAVGRDVAGEVTQILPSADPKSRNFTVKIALDQNQQIIPGMFGRLTLSTQEKAGLMIPESAVIEQFGITGVYRVVNKKAQFTTVTFGSQKGEQVQIYSGLKVGDTIILNPSAQVRDGMNIAMK